MHRAAVAGLAFGAAALAMLPLAATAADLDDDFLRGSFNGFGQKPLGQWDGVNFGAHYGTSSMKSDFGNSTSSLVAYLLRNTTLENEAHPSNWTTLPTTNKNGKSYGGFVGFAYQWDKLVVGLDVTYNNAGYETGASDSITRIVNTSDGYANTVTITAQSTYRLRDFGTVRGRAGYAIGQFLPYVTAGLALGRVDYSTSATVTASGTSSTGGAPYSFGPATQSEAKNNAVAAGFTAGVGVDVAILPNLFLRAEWEFVALGPVGGIKSTINTGRIGVGLKF